MKCSVAATAGATLVLAIAASPASAHVTSFDTGFDAALVPSTGLFVAGAIFSAREKCLSDRKVKFSAIGGTTGETSDLDRSSTNGAFAGFLDGTDANGVKVKVLKKDIGRRQHVHLCESFVQSVFP